MDQAKEAQELDGQLSTLTVPPDPEYARVVRMTAANFAMLADLSVEDVDDVRMAAEEAFVCACATGVGGRMGIEFRVSAGRLDMSFELGADVDGLGREGDQDPALAYARLLLEALCDDVEVAGAPARLNVTKSSGTADAL